MRFPYCLALEGETLAVADTANNRILFWNHLPVTNAGHPVDSVTGQPDFLGNGENQWKAVQPDTLCCPYALALHGMTMVAANSGNNRVTIWRVDTDSGEVFTRKVSVMRHAGDHSCASPYRDK